MNSDHSIPNDVYSNCLQIPVIIACTWIIPSIKRNLCCNDQRDHKIWRYDVYRMCISNMVGWSLLISIAMIFQGRDLLNLYTLFSVDITVGVAIDILLIRALRVGGMPIGYYGQPPDYSRFIWNTMTIVAITVASRCTSAIAAIFMFPFVNDSFLTEDINVPEPVTYVVLPLTYFVARHVLTDRFHRHSEGYVKATLHTQDFNDVDVTENQITEHSIAISDDDEDDNDQSPSDHVDQLNTRPERDSEITDS